ncbi:MAG: hypothetical protein LBF22_05090, partial [Deltaproteobacteria bacterium]|nr:hypothetical protein [Deltaproteobacteria bacterium]
TEEIILILAIVSKTTKLTMRSELKNRRPLASNFTATAELVFTTKSVIMDEQTKKLKKIYFFNSKKNYFLN